jgi:hypothetical protein
MNKVIEETTLKIDTGTCISNHYTLLMLNQHISTWNLYYKQIYMKHKLQTDLYETCMRRKYNIDIQQVIIWDIMEVIKIVWCGMNWGSSTFGVTLDAQLEVHEIVVRFELLDGYFERRVLTDAHDFMVLNLNVTHSINLFEESSAVLSKRNVLLTKRESVYVTVLIALSSCATQGKTLRMKGVVIRMEILVDNQIHYHDFLLLFIHNLCTLCWE